MRYRFVVEIDRPIDEVWAFGNDTFNAPRLGGQSITFRQTSRGPVGVGTTYEGRAMVLGFETTVRGSITEWDPPHIAAASLAGRPVKVFVLRETYEALPEGGTRVERVIDLELPLILWILWPILKPFVVPRWRKATNNMKTILEASSGPDGSERESRATRTPVAIWRTVMFTDIVRSTSLLEAIGDAAWRDLRRWHDETLREAFARHSGRELDHAGDGFCVAFGSAPDAVACAVDIERTLREHRKTAGFAPQVRIGLHTGELQPDGETMTGSAMHIASRVAASAGGGEILATATTIAESGVAPAASPQSVNIRGMSDPQFVAEIPW